MLRKISPLIVSALIGCSVDLGVPDNVLVTCEDGLCPTGYNCNNARLCVPSTSDDSVAPSVASASYAPAIVGVLGTSRLTLEVTEPLLIDPVVQFTNNSVRRRFEVTSKSGTRYELAYTVQGDELDGESSVTADLIDLVGNTNTAVVPSIVIDQRPPSVVASGTALTLTPKRASNPLAQVTAITTGTQVRLTFTTDEAISTPPIVIIGGSLELTATAIASTVFVVDQEWNAPGLTDGVQSVDVVLVDPAGNTTTTPLELVSDATPSGFLVDTTPPRAPVNTTLRRAPWGELDGTAPVGSLTGGAGAVDPGSYVIAYEAPSIDYCATPSCSFAALALANTIADDDGRFDLSLGQTDRRVIYLASVDAAGNSSDLDIGAPGLQPTAVSGVTLVATFNPLPGRTNSNSASAAERLPLRPSELTSIPFDASTLRRRGDAALALNGGYAWSSTGATLGVASFSQGFTSAAANPRFGQVVVSSRTTSPYSSSVASFWIRDASGLNKRNAPGHVASVLVYDPANDGVLAFDGGRMSFWDGAQWSAICPGNVCGMPQGYIGALAPDVSRGVVVWIGASARDVYEWDGTVWTRKCTDASCIAGAPDASVAGGTRDGVNNEVVIVTTEQQTWTWNGTRWLLRCSGCGPSRRDSVTMAYDEARREVVLVGGTPDSIQGPSDFGGLTDTWTWNGTSWSNKSPSTNPGVGVARGMAFDHRRQRIVIMGGYYLNGSGLAFGTSDNFFEWDGRNWLRAIAFDTSFDAIGFDPQSRRTIGTGADDSHGKIIRLWNGREWANSGRSWSGDANGSLTRTTYGANDKLIYYKPDSTSIYTDGAMQQACSGNGCGHYTGGGMNGASLASDGVGATLYVNSFDVYRFNGTSLWQRICTNCGGFMSPAMSYHGSLTRGGRTGFLVATGGYQNPRGLTYLDASWQDGLGVSMTGVTSSVMTYDVGRGAVAWISGVQPPSGGGGGGPPPKHTDLEYISATGSSTELYLTSASEASPVFDYENRSYLATYDETHGSLLVFEKNSKMTYSYSGSAERPALVLSVPLVDSIDFDTDVLDSYTVNWYGTATSTVAGLAAYVWIYDRWVALAVTNQGDHMSATASSGLLRTLSGFSRTLTVALTPAGTNGVGRATLSTDAVNVEIAYRTTN